MPPYLPAAAALLIAALPATGTARTFTLDVTVTRRQAPAQPVRDLEISIVQIGTTLNQVQPARTDEQGKCTLRFESDSPEPNVKFFVTGQNPHLPERWFVYRHGYYTPPDEDAPFKVQSTSDTATLDGFPESEYRLVFREAIMRDNNTSLVSSAVAAAVTLPTSSSGVAQLPDPTQLRASLQTRYQLSAAETDQILNQWQTLVTAAPPTEKLDEKTLVAITQKDLVKANALALQADSLTGAQKSSQLGVLSDTGRLVATTGQLTRLQGQTPDLQIPTNVRDRLARDLQTIHNRVPNTARMAEPIAPEQVQRLRNFSRGAAERSAQH